MLMLKLTNTALNQYTINETKSSNSRHRFFNPSSCYVSCDLLISDHL
jgi:hypothetical protein